jgi:hypothetical protein
METLSTYAQPFFEWLFRSTVQAGIVVCLILLIQAAMRNRLAARWHYALWLILVVRMVLPWAPQRRFSIFNLATWQGKSNTPRLMSELDAESPKAVRESSGTQQTAIGQEQSVKKDGTAVAVTSDAPSRSLGAEPELTSSSEGQDRNLTAPARVSRESADHATHTAFKLSDVLPFI